MSRIPALLCALLLVAGLIGWWTEAQALEYFAPGEWKLHVLALLLGIGGLFITRRAQPDASRVLGWSLASVCACWIWAMVMLPWYERAWWWRTALPFSAISVWMLWLFAQAHPRWGTARRWVLVLLLTAPLLELSLRTIDQFRPTALLARDTSQPRAALERNRPKPGTLRFRVPCNSQGHYDEEFSMRRPGEQRIAVIGDSFSQGSVPLRWHYTSVAERLLGIPVDNYGIAGIGVPEYAHLLRSEVLPRDPSAVVIALFIGNDLEITPESDRRPWEADWLDSRSVLLCLLPRRLARIAEERSANRGRVAQVAGSADQGTGVDEKLYPWLNEPDLEIPTISGDGFLRVEEDRARFLGSWSEDQARELARILHEMRQSCGARRFVVMLIPDEYQIENSLWQQLCERLGDPAPERDRAQRLLNDALGRLNIETLDLLPLMRASEPMFDGRKHLYHLRDTHWNARGNAMAGQALAQLLSN